VAETCACESRAKKIPDFATHEKAKIFNSLVKDKKPKEKKNRERAGP
jgi:hypothetical protein